MSLSVSCYPQDNNLSWDDNYGPKPKHFTLCFFQADRSYQKIRLFIDLITSFHAPLSDLFLGLIGFFLHVSVSTLFTWFVEYCFQFLNHSI